MKTPDEEEELRFYAALGRCISDWSIVESKLVKVYQEAVGAPASRPAAAGFYRAQGLEARIGVVNAAVSVCLAKEPELAKAWGRLHARACKSARTRHLLPQFQVITLLHRPAGRRYEARPTIHDPTHFLKFGPGLAARRPVFDQRALDATVRSLNALSWGLMLFAYRLGRHLGQRERDLHFEEYVDAEARKGRARGAEPSPE